MKSRLQNVIVSVLTVSLITACSNKEDITPRNSHQEDVATPQTSSVEAITEKKSTGKTAEDETSQNTRSADSHTHGDAEVAVVVENDGITIELESPLYNILGFEHAPNTETQKTNVKRAETLLGRGGELFTFNSKANCKITSKDQNVSLFDTDNHDEAHQDDHDEGTHDDPEDEHEDVTHKDVLLRYEFLCQDPSALINMSVNLFEFFSELSEIDVTYLGPAMQKQVILTRDQTRMDILK